MPRYIFLSVFALFVLAACEAEPAQIPPTTTAFYTPIPSGKPQANPTPTPMPTSTGSKDLDQFLLTGECVECDLSGADLSDEYLTRANLSGANLSGAILYMANLSGANLSGAILSGADLSGADLSMADLTRADLTDVWGVDFTGALNVPAKYLKD